MVKVAWLRITNNKGFDSGIAKNSTVIANNDLLKSTQGTGVEVAGTGDTIVGVSVSSFTADSDNFTVDQKRALYTPTDALDEVLMDVVGGVALTFDAALVASNTINMTVNGTAMTQITYATSNDATLDAIAAQLVSQFPTIIKYATRTTTRIISITPVAGATVTLGSIVVAAGASQAAGAQTSVFTAADEDKFYDITTGGVSVATESTTTGQLRLNKYNSIDSGWFAIVNA